MPYPGCQSPADNQRPCSRMDWAPHSGAARLRRTSVLLQAKTSAQAEFISAEHSNHFRGIRGALAPHGTGPTIMGPMISKMFIAAQGSFLYFHAVVGPSSGGAHPVEDVHSMWISLLCQGETARQGCRALQLTGSACQIVKRALQLIRDGGQVMSVRKKALDREGCFYYALALGIELGRLSAKG